MDIAKSYLNDYSINYIYIYNPGFLVHKNVYPTVGITVKTFQMVVLWNELSKKRSPIGRVTVIPTVHQLFSTFRFSVFSLSYCLSSPSPPTYTNKST